MCFVSGGLAGSPHAPAGHRSLLALRWLQRLAQEHVRGAGKGQEPPEQSHHVGPWPWTRVRGGDGTAGHGGFTAACTGAPRAVLGHWGPTMAYTGHLGTGVSIQRVLGYLEQGLGAVISLWCVLGLLLGHGSLRKAMHHSAQSWGWAW